jgi:hypothetical protein
MIFFGGLSYESPGLDPGIARQRRHQRVVAKPVVIVQVLAAERDAERTLPDERGDRELPDVGARRTRGALRGLRPYTHRL